VGAPVTVLGRRDLAGGYVSDAVRRVDLDADGRRPAVVVKRAGTVEIAAMRALAEVPGVPAPRLLAAGPDWIVLPFYPGSPPADGVPVASEVFDVLGRVHTHWRDRCPPGVPVVDAGWWARLCEWTLVAVRGGLARTGDPGSPRPRTPSTGGEPTPGSPPPWTSCRGRCATATRTGATCWPAGTARC
jgi:hypothetical protein